MAKSLFGRIYFNLFLLLSVFSAAQYIYVSYVLCFSGDDSCNQNTSIQALNVEKGLAIVFIFDWILSFILADSKITYITR